MSSASGSLWRFYGSALGKAGNGLLDLIYPPRCLVCGDWQESGSLCDICIQRFSPLLPPFCERCGVPIAGGDHLCTGCARGSAPAYHWSQALGHYSGTLRTAVHRLKYNGKTALASPLGTLLAHSLIAAPTPLLHPGLSGVPIDFDAVVPIPLHWRRMRQRGFNQAERIAFFLARERGWPLDKGGLWRVRSTSTQTALGAESRAANVRDAFRARSSDYFTGRSILIVDDVLTTGSTLKEAARIVRNAGAVRVCVTALARG